MAETIFNEVRYTLNQLINYIDIGEIGLPDIQRPFVWKNNKVRDLLDSIYRGYPVGYLLFWQNSNIDYFGKNIGSDDKQKPARLLIVDGQQRLTALYAIIKGVSVVGEDYRKRPIRIAFNPILEKFEVADAATDRDPNYISNISDVWQSPTLYDFITKFLDNIKKTKELSSDEQNHIQASISKLESLTNFPLTALELSPQIDEEAVADVFVRINSEGTPLNQSDFILTLMSVFWDEGRNQLEEFCRKSHDPSIGDASPYNHFIVPSPDQLLRVSIMLGFKRARLQTVYSILRGKDLESEEFSVERRDSQFEILKKSQSLVLNLSHWHSFMSCLHAAGFRNQTMITSNNNLLFSYLLYLIGRCEYNLDVHEIRPAIAKWFFMSSLTGRFTGSPESRMDYDLAQLRNVRTSQEFLSMLDLICESALPDDFWTVTLPNHLSTSSARTPGLSAFNASLVLMRANVLYSNVLLVDLLDPTINMPRSAIERHHLFPRAYLARNDISDIRETNQIANYAYIEWQDNASISDKTPGEYAPQIEQRFDSSVLNKMYKWHGLPNDWFNMEYQDFLKARRVLISMTIKNGYQILKDDPGVRNEPQFNVEHAIHEGESSEIEFKATLRTNLHTGEKDPKMEYAILRTISGFLNTKGGTLMIGVSDDGTSVGIEIDDFENEDRLLLHLTNLVNDRIGRQYNRYLDYHFSEYDDRRILAVECIKSTSPVFVKDGRESRFYIRTGPSTSEMTGYDMQRYINERF